MKLSSFKISSIVYHDLFDYPLDINDLETWRSGKKLSHKQLAINKKDGFYFVAGREKIVSQRKERERISENKILIAKKASRILSSIPTIETIALTGALAMKNADEDADIDLMIITSTGTLWTTRLLSLLILDLLGIKRRREGDVNQKDKICLNMWLDENNLVWPKNKRNIYTAHEIAQTVMLFDRSGKYYKFIKKNKWILEYWPNVLSNNGYTGDESRKTNISGLVFQIVEPVTYFLQYQYMKSKITNETVAMNRALFHPMDWTRKTKDRLAEV